MSKAKDLMRVVNSITEEEMPAAPMFQVGQKVKCMMGGQEMDGVIKADDAGNFYDAEKGMYFVDMGDHADWCAASDMKLAESKKPTFESRLARFKKRRQNEDGDAMPGEVPPAGSAEPIATEMEPKQALQMAYQECMAGVEKMKECMGAMANEEFDATKMAVDGMDQAGMQLKEAMDADGLSIPDSDQGGAGQAGTTTDVVTGNDA